MKTAAYSGVCCIVLIRNPQIILKKPRNEAQATSVPYSDIVNFIIRLCSKYSG